MHFSSCYLVHYTLFYLYLNIATNYSLSLLVEWIRQVLYYLVLTFVITKRWVWWDVFVLVTTYQDYPFEIVYALTICQLLQKSCPIYCPLVVQVLNWWYFSYSSHVEKTNSNKTTLQLPNSKMRRTNSKQKVKLLFMSFNMFHHSPGDDTSKWKTNNIDMFNIPSMHQILTNLFTS